MTSLPRPEMPRIPLPDQLGPDPEPLGARGDRFLEGVSQDYASPVPTGACPLSDAVGGDERCRTARCPYYRVPGTTRACAIAEWSPNARRDPRIARWFETRRDEIIRGRSVPVR